MTVIKNEAEKSSGEKRETKKVEKGVGVSNKLKITRESGLNTYCYLSGIESVNNRIVLSVDFIQWLKDPDSPSGIVVKNENPKLRHFIVDDSSVLYELVDVSEEKVIDVNTLQKNLEDYKQPRIWIISTINGKVFKMTEQYLP